ncbi:hypothetical protein Tco_0466017 [Tanacetum coccineum]
MDDRSEAVKKVYYRWMSHEDCSMPQFVTFKKDFFWDVDEFTLPINPADIIELLTGEKLGTNILALFSRTKEFIFIDLTHEVCNLDILPCLTESFKIKYSFVVELELVFQSSDFLYQTVLESEYESSEKHLPK